MNFYRLLLTDPADGAWNMAVDEAILEAVGGDESFPTLRFYAWQPACLSLGYAQSIKDVDRNRLAESGWGLVRRITGGRAILHADELTYSVIAPYNEPLVAGNLLDSYNRIARALLMALQNLDMQAEINENTHGSNVDNTSPVCFEEPSAYEITVQGKKLIGSAQARRKQGILQHGSLPLYGNLGRITQVLAFEEEEERRQSFERLMNHATNVESVTGIRLDWDTAVQYLVDAFRSGLSINLENGGLSSTETERANELVRTKYTQSKWTARL
jgi:lipoate-protein ligase A